MAFGTLQGLLTGKNGGAGRFYLQGVIQHSSGAMNITHWDAQALRDTMRGNINYQVRIDGLPGTGAVATHLVNVTRQ